MSTEWWAVSCSHLVTGGVGVRWALHVLQASVNSQSSDAFHKLLKIVLQTDRVLGWYSRIKGLRLKCELKIETFVSVYFVSQICIHKR